MSKPAPFRYHRASSLEDACTRLAALGDSARVLAGGQSLLPAMALRMSRPEVLIDINRIAGLGAIEARGDDIHIGALARHADVLASPVVRARLPLLAAAMQHVANPAVRRRGSFCGSLCQADPAAEIPACLLALGGVVRLASTRGIREIAAPDFLRGLMETAREADELAIGVRLPAAEAGERVAWQELAPRAGDFAIVGVGARARLVDGRIRDLAVMVFACEPRPHLSDAARTMAEGERPGEGLARAIAARVAGELAPMSDLAGDSGTKRRQAEALVRRAVLGLAPGTAMAQAA